jgi:putative nucleotidyltransferase with HDIG domain
MAGPQAFSEDPLRVLRMVRMAVELGFEVEPETLLAATRSAASLGAVSAERIFAELRRIIAAEDARRGLEMLSEIGAGAVVLGELEAMRGIEQNRFHHLDVHGHTLEVFERTIELTAKQGVEPDSELGRAIAPHGQAVTALLTEPLADEMSRGEALRWGALLHDAAKPLTRELHPGARVSFIGHDVRGAELARSVLSRLRASERLRAHVAALVRHHLRLGFLVHEPQPLSRRIVFSYLRECSPVEVDVTLLSIADRLATRGDRAEESIAAHLQLARLMLTDALQWRARGPAEPLLRGDELARELGIATGPLLGKLLEALAEAQYAGELGSREQALAYARERVQTI